MTTRVTRDKWTPEETEETAVVEEDEAEVEEDVETLHVMDLNQDLWKEILTKNLLAVAQSQDIEEHVKSEAQDLTATVLQVEMISMWGHGEEAETEVTEEEIEEANEEEAAWCLKTDSVGMGQEAISTIDLQENLTVSAHTAMIMMEADQIIDLEVDMNNEEDITNTEVVLHAVGLMGELQGVHLMNHEWMKWESLEMVLACHQEAATAQEIYLEGLLLMIMMTANSRGIHQWILWGAVTWMVVTTEAAVAQWESELVVLVIWTHHQNKCPILTWAEMVHS
jgi:hypothetical protein